jgi:hypothetical protein
VADPGRGRLVLHERRSGSRIRSAPARR